VRAAPPLRASLLAAAVAEADAGLGLALLPLLLDAPGAPAPEEAQRQALLEGFVKAVLLPAAGGGAPAASDMRAYAALLQRLSDAQVATTLLPALGKALKTRVEAVLPCVAGILAALPTGSGSGAVAKGFEEQLLPVLLAQASLGKDDHHCAVADATAALARHLSLCGATASVAKLTGGLVDIVTKKKASVPLWQSRHGVARALAAVAKALVEAATADAPACAALAKDVGGFIVQFAPKEVHDLTRGASLRALGHWLALGASNGAALPADVAAALVAGLKASQTGAGANDGYTELLYTVACSPLAPAAASLCKTADVIAALVDFAAKSASAALAAGKKGIGAPVNLVFALAALVRLGRLDATVAARMTAAKVAADAAGSTAGASSTAGAAAAKKPAAGAAAKPAGAAGKAAAAAAALAASLGATAPKEAKVFTLWDCFTAAALAPVTLFAPALLATAGRTLADVEANGGATLLALVDAVVGALTAHTEALKPYGKVYRTAVEADLAGAASTAADAASPKKPSALFAGLLSLLLHPLRVVREGTAAGVHAAYTQPRGSDAEHPHAALPQCLLHALFDRVRNSEAVSPALSAEAPKSTALHTGIGDGPVAAAAARAELLANNGRCPGFSSNGPLAGAAADAKTGAAAASTAAGSATAGASGADSGADASAAVLPAQPPPRLYQAAFKAMTNAHNGAAPLDGALLLPVCLFLCAHPVVSGGVDDRSLRAGLVSSLACAAAPMPAADAATTSLCAPVVGSAQVAANADPRGNVRRGLWKRTYCNLVLSTGTLPSDARATAPTESSGSDMSVPASSIDQLIQREAVSAAMLAHFKGSRWGLWAPCHTLRIAAARALGLLMLGTGFMVPARAQRKPSECGACTGARFFVLSSVLPLLTDALLDGVEANISSRDAEVWRTPEGKLAPAEVVQEEGLWHSDISADGSAPKHSAQNRTGRSKGGNGWKDMEEEAWIQELKADLAEKKAAAAFDAASGAAMAAMKAKGAIKGTISVGGAAGATKGGKGAAGGKDEDPLVARLRQESATRAKVQQTYESVMGALHALSAILRANPASAQNLVPSLLPSLLPCLAVGPVADYTSLVVREALQAAARQTILEAGVSRAPAGLFDDWTRCLQIIQGSHGNSHGGAEAAVASATSGITPEDLGSDATGDAGQDLSKCGAVFKRVIAPLFHVLLPHAAAASAGMEGGPILYAQDFAAIQGLPTALLQMLFPVLRAAMTSSPPLAVMQQALALLAAHVVLPRELAARVNPVFATQSAGKNVVVELAPGQLAVLPLGAGLADGSGKHAMAGETLTKGAGVRFAAHLFSGYAAMIADARAETLVQARSSTSMAAPAAAAEPKDQSACEEAYEAAVALAAENVRLGTGVPDSDYFSLRLLRESITLVLLHILRTAPRANPAPDQLLLNLVRGRIPTAKEVAAVAANRPEKAAKDSDDEDSDDEEEESDEEDSDDDESYEGPDPALIALGTSPLHTMSLGETSPLVGNLGLLSKFTHVRAAALHALDIVLSAHIGPEGLKPSAVSDAAPADPAAATEAALIRGRNTLLTRLWVSIHDVDEDNASHASMLWKRHGCELGESNYTALLMVLSHPEENIRTSASKAIAAALQLYPKTADATLKSLTSLFIQYGEGLMLTMDGSWKTRAGVMACLTAAAEVKAIPIHALPIVLPFIIQRGLPDRSAVGVASVAAGRALVDAYGSTHVHMLLPVLEGFLEKGSASPLAASTEEARDTQREGAVVLLGACAKHLPPSDPKVTSILKVLLDTLNTPSETVQKAVAQCLPPLTKALKDEATNVLPLLMDRLLKSPSFAVRRGAAFGLAGCVKGFGLASLKQNNIMQMLEDAAQDQKSEAARQGALFAFETLCDSLGMLFEPYVIRILPFLLKSFGDSSAEVRDAAQYASKAVMAILTGHGVKLVMPAVLKGLSEPAWRSKQASIQLLGNMAYCAPKQLSQCLPQIVPRLCEALEDPHPKVQAAGKDSLNDIGKVIKNPEISNLVPVLHAAIIDPAEKTKDALATLSSTDFVHAIDPASLALLVPILRRGLADRSTAVKVSAGVITGNMCALISDPKDIIPYLSILMPALKKTVCDPIPDVRAVSSRALGNLFRELGESEAPDLLPWLIETMKGDNNPNSSTVERSGAAQGIAEVLVALGEPKLSEVVRELLLLGNHPRAPPREGLLWLLVFLPAVMGRSFNTLLRVCMPTIVQRMADDTEMVREVALRAGQVIVKQYAKTDAQALLPSLESGLAAASWRIRCGAIGLVGELMAQVSGSMHFQATVVGGNTLGGNITVKGASAADMANQEEDDEEEDDDDEEDEEDEDASDEESDESESEEEEAATGAVRTAKKPKAAKTNGGPAGAENTGRSRAERKQAKKAISGRKNKAGVGADEEVEIALDETYSASAMGAASAAVARTLGLETRNRILATLYMIRADVSLVVRQQAMRIWKDLVQNTPKTLREILAALMKLLISALAATGESGNAYDTVGALGTYADERRLVAGRTLGEVVRKLGDRVLPEIVPILRRGLQSDVGSVRQGVCLGLAEVIEAAARRQIEAHVEVLIPAVRDALCDVLPDVRDAAARAFNVLQRCIGNEAVDMVVPSLLEAIDTTDADVSARAMSGLQCITALRSKEILPSLMPRLLAPPLTLFNVRALASVAQVTGAVLHFHMSTLLPVFVAALSGEEKKGKKEKEAAPEVVGENLSSPLAQAIASVLCSVDDMGVAWTLSEISKFLVETQSATHRRVAASLLRAFLAGTQADWSANVPMVLKELLSRFADSEEDVLRACWDAVNTLVNGPCANPVPVEDLADELDLIRSVINSLASDARFRKGGVGSTGTFHLPAFCLADRKGLDCILPIYQRALKHGTFEAREAAAAGLGELVEMTPSELLKPFFVKLTGPLILVVADKFPWQVKSAILSTLSLLLEKGGVALKPFQPQLQTTFVKALQDPTQGVRTRAAVALGQLMALAVRVDPLIQELATGASNSVGGVQHSMLLSLVNVFRRVGDRVSSAARCKVFELCLGEAVAADGAFSPGGYAAVLYDEDEEVRQFAGMLLGAALRSAEPDVAKAVLGKVLLAKGSVAGDGTGGNPVVNANIHGKSCAVAGALRFAPAVCVPILREVIASITATAASDAPKIRSQAGKALGWLLANTGGRNLSACAASAAGASPASSAVLNAVLASSDSVLSADFASAELAASYTKAAAVATGLVAKLLADSAPDVRVAALQACKRFAKHSIKVVASQASVLMPAIITLASKDGGISAIRTAVDRALYYLTQSDPTGSLSSAQAVLAASDAETQRFLPDYTKRQLCRLAAEDTDDESEL
jgi:hypothetical protein